MSEVYGITNIDKASYSSVQATKKASTTESDFSSYLKDTNGLDGVFEKAAEKYKVPVNLLKAIGKAESGFDEKAVSRCGAQGVMQLMPATAKSLGVKDSLNAEQNIMGGAKYIAGLLKKYDGDTKLALAAYNAGSGNVAKYGGIPPFKETQNYVKKVMKYLNQDLDSEISAASKKSTETVRTAVKATVKNNVIISPTIDSAPIVDEEPIVETDAIDVLETLLDSYFSHEDYLNFLLEYSQEEEAKEEGSSVAFQSLSYNIPGMKV